MRLDHQCNWPCFAFWSPGCKEANCTQRLLIGFRGNYIDTIIMVLLPSFSKTCFWCAVCRCRNSCDKFLWTMRSILYHVTCVTRDWKPSECTCEKLIRFCSTAGILWQGSPPGIDQEDKDFDRESKLRRLAV